MADFDNGDVVRLGASFLYQSSEQVVNVWTVKIESGGSLTFAQGSLELAEYVDELYQLCIGWYKTTFTSDRISVKNETQNTVWGSIAFENVLAGTQITDPLPQQVALLGWGRTPISRVQIRKYFGPLTENALSAGQWSSSVRASFQDVMDYHITSQTMTGGLELRGVAYNKPLDRATPALTATTAVVPVVQRRRRLGRGS